MRILTPWTSQPQIATEIDWANHITRGLWFVYNPAAGKLYGPKSTISTTGVVSKSMSATGVNDTFSGSQYRSVDGTSGAPSSGSLSILVVGNRSVSSNTQPLISRSTGNVSGGFEITLQNEYGSPTTRVYSSYHNGSSQIVFDSAFVNGVASSANGDPDTITGKDYAIAVSAYSIPTNVKGVDIIIGGLISGASSRYLTGGVSLAAVFNRKLSSNELKSLSQNPWQIFKPVPRRIFVPVSAATGDGTGIGSLYAITLSSPTATAAGTANATATGSLAASTLTAPTGSASAGTSATATGAFAASSLSAPSATATGSALATGALTTVTLTTIAASANGSALATGAFAASSLSAPSATATGSALATGALTTVTLTTITASANGSALATGTIDQIDLSTVAGNATGTTAGNAEGVGSVATIALSAPAASAIGSALATGSFAAISLGTVSGSASAATDGQAAASIQPISISAPLAIAIASSVATGGIQSIGLTAPTGAASGEAQTIARPTSDISNTGWTPSTGSDLYAMLDEVSPDDADYISTSTLGAVCKMSLNATQYPGGASQQLSLRASSATGNGILVTIKDGATTIASRTLTLTPTFDLHTITLTSGEIAAITSGNLTVEMTST